MAMSPSPSSSPLPRYLQEEALEERKNFISTLPREKSWLVNHLYQYQGFWYNIRQLQGILATQTLFKAQPTDLFLVTTPKSGTTWLKAMAFAIKNREHFPLFDDHPLISKNPHDLVPFLEIKLYVDNNIPTFTNSTSDPRLLSTHMPYILLPESIKESKCKIVYLCRNPRDTFISLWHFVNKIRPQTLGPLSLEEAFNRFCRGASLYGPFWDHVLSYWKESLKKPEEILFLKYEEIKENPKVNLRRLAEFLGYPFSLEEEQQGVVDEILKLCSFETLSNLEVNRDGNLSSGEENQAFFRKGEVGDWVNHLSPDMIEQLDRISEEKFRSYGLEF